MRVIALVALVLVAAGCGSHRGVVAKVTPARSVEAQPVSIRVEGLHPHQRVSLTLRSKDAFGVQFSSHAAFTADGDGVVDLARAKPLAGGSYTGAWQMGLLTSMSAAKPFSYYQWEDAPQTFRLSAASGGRTIATTSFTRIFVRRRPRIVRTTVAKQGFLGAFFAPRGAVHRPAVLAFGGSEGGAGSRWEGDQLAANGIPALVIGYFHAPTLPDRLLNIPLEYFRKALQWLEQRPEVDLQRTSVMSASYGTEAALLLGVHYPSLVHGVVALTPSGVVTCGIPGADRTVASGRWCLGSPWTLGGKPLPHTKLLNNPSPWDVPRAVIPVQRIKAPVFVSCGAYDTEWSSCAYAQAIVKRRHGEPTVFRKYPDAGHYSNGAFFEYEPGAMAHDVFTPEDERAREDLTPRVLRFLRSAS